MANPLAKYTNPLAKYETREVNPLDKYEAQKPVEQAKQTALSTLSKLPIAGFTPEQLTKSTQAYGEAFRRPLAGLTALATETPFADPEKGVGKTFLRGVAKPEEYPPERMTDALVDAGMQPYEAASLATLGQVGYYLGLGRVIAGGVGRTKVKLLDKTVRNINKAIGEAQKAGQDVSKLKVDVPEELAKSKGLSEMLELYMKSKGLKMAPKALAEPGVTPQQALPSPKAQFAPQTQLPLPPGEVVPDVPQALTLTKQGFTPEQVINMSPETYTQISEKGLKTEQVELLPEGGFKEKPIPSLVPEEAPKQLEWTFPKKAKVDPTIMKYWTPAEYYMDKMGVKEFIHKPVSEGLKDFSIELQKKGDLVKQTQKEFPQANPDKIYEYMNKGIPEETTPEAKVATRFRAQTEEMLERLNDVRKLEGKPPVVGLQNYILHAVQPEILNEIYDKGTIPLELAKVMEHIPPHTVWLRTAQLRKGVPEEWLVKDPYKLMRMMYAIDLRYVHLQKALLKIKPYYETIKKYKGDEKKGIKPWSDESYRYVKGWVEQAIKQRPSEFDNLINNLIEGTIAPILRNVGIKVSNMPWRDLQMFLSTAVHTGALGARPKVVLRNLVQSTFDWVMYGSKWYLKGSKSFMTPEGQKLLNKSKVWRTRMPYEAEEKAFTGKIFKAAGVPYRFSDLHNVGKAILTRYYYAQDKLGYNHTKALAFADEDYASTQWSYRREDMPQAFWTTTGRAFWTLGSWWMNYWFRFMPEILNITFKGENVKGEKMDASRRLAGLRLLMLGATLWGLKKATKGVADYTGQLTPSLFRTSPQHQMMEALIKIFNGMSIKNDREIKEGLKELAYTSKVFIPLGLGGEDLIKLITGKKTPSQVLFYGKPKKRKGAIGSIGGLKGIKGL